MKSISPLKASLKYCSLLLSGSKTNLPPIDMIPKIGIKIVIIIPNKNAFIVAFLVYFYG